MERRDIARLGRPQAGRNPRCTVSPPSGGNTPMETSALHIDTTSEPVAEMDRLGHEIAELSAHLDAATTHLLDLIREFDARGGWNNGFPSRAHWLALRRGVDLGALRAPGCG